MIRRLPLLFISTQLFAFNADPFIQGSPPEKRFSPSSDAFLIGGLVNPATGQFSLSATDLVAMGNEALSLTRHYYPPHVKEEYSKKKKEDEDHLGQSLTRRFGWIFFPHLVATVQYTDQKGLVIITITEPDGSMLYFQKKKSESCTLESKGPFTNSNGEIISGMLDSRNTSCNFESKILTVNSKDGATRYYEYGNGSTYYLKKEHLPNGKIVVYTYDDRYFLVSIETKDSREEHTYAKIMRNGDSEWITHTGQKATYQFGCISAKGSYFPQKKGIPLGHATYDYKFSLLSEVHSPLSNHLYGYDARATLCWQSNQNPVFSSTHSPHKEFLRISNLQLPVGTNDQIIPTHAIAYDATGTNVIHPDQTKTTYCFTSNFLPLKIEHEGKITNYEWDTNNHLTALEVEYLYRKEYEVDSYGNPIIEVLIGNLSGDDLYERYHIHREYHKNLLLKEETDSGLKVSYSYLPGTNLITSKIMSGSDGLYKEEYYTYDEYNNLIETLIDEKKTRYILRQEHPHLHMIEWVEKEDRKVHLYYDQFGHVSQEDHYDANGEFVYSISKEFNEKGQLISETNAMGQRFIYTYDLDGHLTSSSKPKQMLQYDRRGRLKTTSDALYTTTFKYDSSDNLVEKTDRFGSIYYFYENKNLIKTIQGNKVTESSYDPYGREIARTDRNGNTIHLEYNSRNQPIEIFYPNGSTESFQYYLDGKLKNHTDKEGNNISYTYDGLGRTTSKTYADIGEEIYVYNHLYLLSYTDLEGYTTHYFYDDLGRKIKEERCGRVKKYSYDSLSRLASTTKGGITTYFTYDLLDRIIEEKTPYSSIRYTYDQDGNQSSITVGERRETFSYDPLKRLIQQTDPLGNTSTIEYTDFGKITTDPHGIVTTETYDIYQNLISKEIPNVIAFRYFRDHEGNLLTQEEDVYKNGEYIKTLATTYAYDTMNQLLALTRSGETTTYTYTPSGKVKTRTKPNGSILEYSYDPLGYMISAGSDHFLYNKLGYLIEGTGFSREIDPFGNVLREHFANGLTIEKTYDDLDRFLTVKLPTGTIEYSYDLLLKTISYKGYTHTYTYDITGDLLTNGFTTYSRDLKGQIIKLTAPHISQDCAYDALGNLTFATPEFYTYDELSQLGSDFDSHFDLPDNPETGNLSFHNGYTLTYDEHDRLVQANSLTFTYDALGRRLSKNQETYLYNGLEEIATFIEGKAYIKIGNAFLDLDGTIVIPLFHATQQLRYLINPINQEILNSYEFDPFGTVLDLSESLYNPYRYAFKHYDEETDLVYFGKRYYDPSTRRWITPDPLGPIDTINLYAFVRNNPLRYTDYTGLFSSPIISTPTLDHAIRCSEYPYNHSIELTEMKAPYTYSFDVGYYNRFDKALFHINGIDTPFERAEYCTKKISQYAGGHKTTGIYNPSNSAFNDLCEYGIRARPIHTITSQASKELYYNLVRFHLTAPPTAKAFVSSHSGGSTEVRNTLQFSEPAIRNRVLSVSIGPSAIISNKLCFNSFNYASDNDIVAKLAAFLTPSLKDQITYLKPHPNASKLNDHAWDSPTYQPVIYGHINDYFMEP